MLFRTCAIILGCLVSGFCSDSELLAKSDSFKLDLTDFYAYLARLPPSQSAVPVQPKREPWLREKLQKLAIQQLLERDPQVVRQLAMPAFHHQLDWQIVQLLAKAERQAVAAGLGEMDSAILAAAFEKRRLENQANLRVTFQHIFLRTDERRRLPSKAEVRRLAEDLCERARRGESFAELARTNSQSANAASGGLVKNNRINDLDQSLRSLFRALQPDEVSDVIATRTGLHIFKLIAKAPPPFDATHAKRFIRMDWQREQLAKRIQAHLKNQTSLYPVVETESFLVSPSWRFRKTFVNAQMTNPDLAASKTWVLEHLVLAEAGKSRGLEKPHWKSELRDQAVEDLRQERMEEHFQAYVLRLPVHRIRELYDAHKSAFASKTSAHLHLIFVPRAQNSFAQLQELEKKVAQLRAGRDFVALAKAISKAPSADQGGNLGVLTQSQWAQYHPKIQAAVMAMAAGNISDPIYCTSKLMDRGPNTLLNGFAIVKVSAKIPPRTLPFEDVLDQVRKAYAVQNKVDLMNELEHLLLGDIHFEILRLPADEAWHP